MTDDVTKINMGEENTEKEAIDQNLPGGIDAESFEATKRLIQNISVKIDELKSVQREYRERLKNLTDNDVALGEFEQQAKDAALAFKKRKKELMESVEAKEIKAKMKELNEELGDMQDSLTNHLLNYFQVTGTQSFETPTGDEREFKLNAKLLPAKNQ